MIKMHISKKRGIRKKECHQATQIRQKSSSVLLKSKIKEAKRRERITVTRVVDASEGQFS